MTYSNDTLKEFLNGTLAEDTARAIETALETDTELGERIMALDTFAAPIREVMEVLPSQDRIERLQANIETAAAEAAKPAVPSTSWGWQKVAASIAIGLVVGWSANTISTPTPEPTKPSWRMEVASYQKLYVSETVAHLDTAPATLTRQFERASKAVNLDLMQDALKDVENLTLARAQVLGFSGKPLVQIVYKDAKGMPIALCIIAKNNEAPKDTTKFEDLRGLSSATWETGTHQFLLIGDTTDTDIKTWSNELQATFKDA